MNDKKDLKQKKNIHSGHRERLKEQAALYGIDHWPQHQVLEHLLFFAIPQRDTNEIAHKLIDKYGSLVDVFKASFDSLKEIKGLGDNSAALITLIPKLFRYVENIKVNQKSLTFEHVSQVAQYMIPKFYNVKKEILYVLILDNKQSLISADIVLEGVINRINVDPRVIMEKVMAHNASNIVLCHNHPDGLAAPSYEDIMLTKKIVEILGEFGINVLDHIIVADNEYCSMMEMEYLNYV